MLALSILSAIVPSTLLAKSFQLNAADGAPDGTGGNDETDSEANAGVGFDGSGGLSESSDDGGIADNLLISALELVGAEGCHFRNPHINNCKQFLKYYYVFLLLGILKLKVLPFPFSLFIAQILPP